MRREVLSAYLAAPETQKLVRKLVHELTADGTPADVCEDIAQEAYITALSAQSLPRSAVTMQAWLKTIVRRSVCDHFRRQKPDRAWLKRDEDIEEQAAEPEDPPQDAWLVHDWLKAAVSGDEQDSETFEMLTYKARTGKTDREVAEDHGLTYAAWTHRLSRFKKKYVARYEKRRMSLLLLWGAGVALVALAAALLLRVFLHRAAWREVEPRPQPSASVPTPPAPIPTEQAPEPFNAATQTEAGPPPSEDKPRR